MECAATKIEGDSMTKTDNIALYKEKAEAVACQIVEFKSIEEAFPYIMELVKKKPACELLNDEDVEKGPNLSANDMPTRLKPVLAAPDLDDELYAKFSEICAKEGFTCVKSGLRKYLAGIDVGIAQSVFGIAETGTCAVNTNNEDTRLATMISELCILTLKKSTIKPSVVSVAEDLRSHIGSFDTSYTTFMSGPSRTADIERVGAIGVHGCLEMHIILLEA